VCFVFGFSVWFLPSAPSPQKQATYAKPTNTRQTSKQTKQNQTKTQKQLAAAALRGHLEARLAAYRRPLWADLEVLEDPKATPRQKVRYNMYLECRALRAVCVAGVVCLFAVC
jgi:N-acetylmuramoyl-L-alanine amidase